MAIDTSNEACALACTIVSNPQGTMQRDGWQKQVNDLIRALRDERNRMRDGLNAAIDWFTPPNDKATFPLERLIKARDGGQSS